MKIALVSDWYYPRVGGLEMHLRDLAGALDAAGQEVVVVTPTRGAERVDGIRVRRIDAPVVPRLGFLYTRSGVRAIRDALAEECVDVAHCHVSIVSPAALGGAAGAQRLGIATVVTFHSIVPQTRALARVMAHVLGTRRWRVRYTAVSRRVAREVEPFAARKPIGILPNGIDVEFWREPEGGARWALRDGRVAVGGGRLAIRGRRGSMQRHPVDITASPDRQAPTANLITVMRLNAKKRPLALVDLMERLRTLVPSGHEVRLRVVGDGPKRSALERAVRRRGLVDAIEVLGAKTRDEIRDLLSESDVFVLPAVRESFGIAALEARCAGVPVVAMASSGVSELIEHGREGLLARSDGELAEQVARLVRDERLRESIACHNQTTTPSFDWPDVLAAHLAVYCEAVTLRDSVWADTKR